MAYDWLPYGHLSATRQKELTSRQEVETTRVEWQPAAVGGFKLRYTETRSTPADAPGTAFGSKLVEVDLPPLTPQHPERRLDLRAALMADPSSTTPGISSRLSGRLGVFNEVALMGETELGLAHSDGRQMLRNLRLTTDVPVMQDMSVQLLYTYQTGTPFSFGRAFEARVSRTIKSFTW